MLWGGCKTGLFLIAIKGRKPRTPRSPSLSASWWRYWSSVWRIAASQQWWRSCVLTTSSTSTLHFPSSSTELAGGLHDTSSPSALWPACLQGNSISSQKSTHIPLFVQGNLWNGLGLDTLETSQKSTHIPVTVFVQGNLWNWGHHWDKPKASLTERCLYFRV